MSNTETPQQQPHFFDENSPWLKICLIVMFMLATLMRLDEIKAPGHLLDREYTSAIFARAYYFANNDSIEDWRRDIAFTAKAQQPVLEPPLIDYLVSLIYRVVGRDDVFLARYLTNAFWLIGGIFMFLIGRRLLSTDEAVVATAYYLFVPMGIIISRSFQPDSLMMMLFLISFYLLILHFETPSIKGLLLAAALTGITLLLRPLVIFAIFGAFLSFSVYRSQNWKKVIDLHLIIFGTVSLLPSMLYYGYGILFAGFMRWKISTSFMPYLLIEKEFWLGWFDNVVNIAEVTPLFLAMIGFFLLRNGKVQYLVIGLASAFMLFTVAFTYHIHTHPYYHIQLFPIIGLCIAPLLVGLINTLREKSKVWWMPVTATLLLALFLGYREVRGSLYRAPVDDPGLAWEIGEIIGHSPRTVFVSRYYGLPLQYYGEFAGAPWPVRIEEAFYRRPGEKELSVQERLDALGFIPEYFVVTHFDLYTRKHQDLQDYLEANCSTILQEDAYWIYGSCSYRASQ